jgi:hypothetical protein
MMTLKNNTIVAACICLISLAACNNANKNDAKNTKGLPATLVNNPYTANGIDSATLRTLATMDFVDTLHDFGTMHAGEKADYDFVFKNNGKNPLIITKATGSCGCTVPDYPHEPIAPGQSNKIHVRFNSTGKFGPQNKSVTILTNSTKGTHMLFIKADVLDDEAAKK